MADMDRTASTAEIDSIAEKLGPAFESLTDDEREVFALVMGKVAGADAEVSGFAQSLSLGMETLGSLNSPQMAAGGGAAAQGRLSWFRSCKIDCCNQPGGGHGSA